ncbi:MAG: lamin tail domain-containing protein [Candidatus Nealsonbacteria bacterium]
MLCVIANFVLGNIVFAKNIAEIDNKDVEKIKTGLDLVKAVINFTIRDDKLKTILNTAIDIGDTSTDITYGLLVLTALNEMEFIDLVVSQRYKTVARNYFNSVLDERLNLLNYYTGIGYDLPRIISGNIAGPISVLTLNAFSITNKTIDIFIALENIKTVKSYNGLWFYFDLRKSNESHKTAWEEAKIIMGWAAESTSFCRNIKRNDIKSQLELQFAALFDEWGSRVTINKGVNEQYKKQVQKELQNTVVTAYESYKFVEKEVQPSFTERARMSLNNLLEKISKIPVFVANTGKNIQKKAQKQLNEINSQIQKLAGFISSFGPGMAVKVEEASEQLVEPEIVEKETEISKLSVVAETQELLQIGGPEPSLDRLSLSKEDIQEIIDDISERVDILAQEVKELIGEEVQVEEEFKEEIEEEQEESIQDEEQELAEEQELNENIVYYSGGVSYSPPSPVFLKILITEVQIASENNKKDDFVELYNPNSENIDLSNWYVQRKTKSGANFSTYASKNLFSGKFIKTHDYFLIANASSSFSADVLTTYPLTEDNTLVLKNPNREISDKVGWGQAQDFETNPIENPLAGESIGRKWSTTNGNYIDTDNNYQDFEIQEPSPSIQNKSKIEPEPEPELENQLPVASFIFTPEKPFVDEEILFDASSSTDSDGQIVSFVWDFSNGSSTTTNQAIITYFFTTSSDFIVSLNVIDNLGATSSPATTTVNVIKETVEKEPSEEISPLSVVINEIAWMGTVSSTSDEWIELYNNTEQDIDLTGWRIMKDGEVFITISTTTAKEITEYTTTTISAHQYYLLERTDDDTISDVFADWIGSFIHGLNNNGEKLELKDASGNLIDVIDCSSGWFAGENQEIDGNRLRVSMERINSTSASATSTNWASNNLIIRSGEDIGGNNIYGTPKAKNSVSMFLTLVSDLPFDDIISEFNLAYRYSPYLVTDNLLVPKDKTLFIEEGVVVKFCQDCELIVEGTVQTPTTSSEEIIFTSYKDDDYGGDTNGDRESKGEEGDWRRIYFKNSFGSELNNIIVKYGGELSPTGAPFPDSHLLPAIHIEGGEVDVKNATITDNFIRGMWIDNSSSTISNVLFSNINNSSSTRPAAALYITEGAPIIQNCSFLDNSIGVEIKDGNSIIKNCSFLDNTTGIQIQNGAPYIENNTFENNEVPISLLPSASPNFFGNIAHTQNNDINGILIGEGDVITDTTWQADLPYTINMNLIITQTGRLTLQPGVVVKFKKQNEEQKLSKNPSIFIYGKLIAEATLAQPIVFTSFSDDDYGGDTNNNGNSTLATSSDWIGLRSSSSDAVLVLDEVIIRYGGLAFKQAIGAVEIGQDVDITIKNSIFKNNELPITYEGANCTTTEQKINELKTNHNVIFCDNVYDYKVPPECSVISSTKCSDL